MLDTAKILLETLHSELSSLNGFMVIAPKNASYPLLTYTILYSRDGRVKSFTSDSKSYIVQFSYFSDKSLNDCLDLAISVENTLDNLSAFLDIDNGNTSILGNTEQHNYYQLNDIRTIEIAKDLS